MGDTLRVISIVAILILPATALSADLEKGLSAYNETDYATSLTECLPLAEQGNPIAQFCVARLYGNGFGVPMDDALALKWYGLAAEQGHSEAQFNLGVMYANGWGVGMNDEQAARLYRLSAEQGFVPAQKAFASVCKNGRGVELSAATAYQWYFVAGQLGDRDAAFKADELADKVDQEELLGARHVAESWLEKFDGKTMQAGRID
jgi:TPR repeat protein